MTDDDRRVPHKRILNRDFLLLWQGQLISQLGNQAFSLAMMYWLMESTGSASLMGLVMMVSLLPGVVLGPFGGALADRHSRLRIIVLSDVLRGLAVGALAAAVFLRPDEPDLIVGALLSVGLFNGIVNAAFQPAITAAIPDLVPETRVAAGNSMTQFATQCSVLIGQAIGGMLYRLVGAGYLFFIDGITYMVSALSEAFIRLPRQTAKDAPAGTRLLISYARDTAEGLQHVWRRPGMRSFLLTTASVNLLAMPIIVLLPFYTTERLVRGPAWYGFLLAAFGAGSLVGYLLAGVLSITPQRRQWIIATAFVGMGTTLAAVGIVRAPMVALGLFVAVGICTGAVNILVLTLFQIATSRELRGRVMAVVIALSGAVTPLGMLLGGILGDATGKKIPQIYIACGTAMVVVVVVALAQPRLRKFLRWDPAAEEE